MSGAAIRNRVDRNGYQVREDEYERTRSHYTAAQMDRFAEALAFVALELDAQPACRSTTHPRSCSPGPS